MCIHLADGNVKFSTCPAPHLNGRLKTVIRAGRLRLLWCCWVSCQHCAWQRGLHHQHAAASGPRVRCKPSRPQPAGRQRDAGRVDITAGELGTAHVCHQLQPGGVLRSQARLAAPSTDVVDLHPRPSDGRLHHIASSCTGAASAAHSITALAGHEQRQQLQERDGQPHQRSSIPQDLATALQLAACTSCGNHLYRFTP